MNLFGKTVSRAIAAGTLMLALAPLATLPASADTQQLTPFRCFTQDDNIHVVFGPASFFNPPTVQGTTSFEENSGPTVVTYPLYHGSSQGRRVDYVITDASNVSAANVLHVNYVPKLAQALETIAQAGVTEFLFCLTHHKTRGSTGAVIAPRDAHAERRGHAQLHGQ